MSIVRNNLISKKEIQYSLGMDILIGLMEFKIYFKLTSAWTKALKPFKFKIQNQSCSELNI